MRGPDGLLLRLHLLLSLLSQAHPDAHPHAYGHLKTESAILREMLDDESRREGW